MGRCGKPFCTCCDAAYEDGLRDGLEVGLRVGYRLGHGVGYVRGYLDADAGIPPLPEYRVAVAALKAPELIRFLPEPKILSCGCVDVCKGFHLEVPSSSFVPSSRLWEERKPCDVAWLLPCGCYGYCKSPGLNHP